MPHRTFIHQTLFCLLFLSLGLLPDAAAQGLTGSTHYTYHNGDLNHADWTQADFDDSTWTTYPNGTLPQDQPEATGLFRHVLEVDSTLWDVPFALSVVYAGAIDIYLDGQLIHQFGRVGTSLDTELALVERASNPIPLVFHRPVHVSGSTSQHLIAVRYAQQTFSTPEWDGNNLVLRYTFGFPLALSELRSQRVRTMSIHQMFLVGFGLAFAFLHLVLFLFHRPLRANLYFAGLAACSALLVFFSFQFHLSTDPAWILRFVRLQSTTGVAMALLALRMIYAFYRPMLPKPFWWFVVVGLLLSAGALFQPFLWEEVLALFVLLMLLEMARTVVWARVRKGHALPDGIWILELGMAILWTVVLYDLLLGLDVFVPRWNYLDFPAVDYARLSLMLSMSILLGREFNRTKHDLEKQLIQVKRLSDKTLQQERERAQLEAENQRKQLELDAARDLQLSMLPKAMPDHPTVAVSAFMQTATEVGGDYYDFDLADDGTLTFAIGDATGHGTKAGTMVTATKTLWHAFSDESDLTVVLQNAHRSLKQMGLPKLYMALALGRVRDYTLELSGVGLPSGLLYRADTQAIEAIPLKGVPLAGPFAFPYRTQRFALAPGDTLLLMSDGFPERFNASGDMFGYERVVDVFATVVSKHPQDIIDHFKAVGQTWGAGHPPDDDVTILVMQMKAVSKP